MRRYRTCDNPRPANGGRACTGSDSQIQKCNTANCPGMALVQILQFKSMKLGEFLIIFLKEVSDALI